MLKNLSTFICCINLIALSFSLSDIDLSTFNSSTGISIIGASASDETGFCVSYAGDVNGDGVSDVIIGIPKADFPSRNDAGAVYIIFGSKTGLPGSLSLFSTLPSSQGIRIKGAEAGDNLGYSVSYAGDINGDLVDDVVISAPYASPSGRTNIGVVCVIYGKNGLVDIDLSLGLSGSQGFKIEGYGQFDNLGWSVSYAGDVNVDGCDDIIIGAPKNNPSGRLDAGTAYVIYGCSSLGDITLLSGLPSNRGLKILGAAPTDYFGQSVRYAGDVNGDGKSDLIVGAHATDGAGGQLDIGTAYIIFGVTGLSDIDLSTGLSITQGIKIQGENAGDNFGWSVSYAGDVNGDKIDDVIIGAALADPDSGRNNAGISYVIYGQKGPFSNINLATGLSSTQGFKILGNQTADHLGWSVDSAGDLNKDGAGDLIITASATAPLGRNNAGTAYVIYGSKNGLSNIDLSVSFSNTQGFCIHGMTNNGIPSASSAGDINGDGAHDLIIGAPTPNNGAAYIIYGILPPNPVTENEGNVETVKTLADIQNSGTTATIIASKVIGAINYGNPVGMMMCFVVKLLRFYKYVGINYPPKLQYILDQPAPSLISIDGITSAPEKLQDSLIRHILPINFEKYEDDFHSSFLINFWFSLMVVGILLGYVLLVSILEYCTRSYQTFHFVVLKLKESVMWNFFLTNIIEYYGDIALYTSMEMRTVHLNSFLEIMSFVVCILSNIFALVIFTKMAVVLKKLASLKTKGSVRRLEYLKGQFKNYEFLFENLKDSSFLQLSYMLLFTLRFYIFNTLLAYLFNYPLVQTIAFTSMGLIFLLYLAVIRPFKSKIDLFAFITQELVFEVVHACFLALAIMDNSADLSLTKRETVGDVIVICLMLLMGIISIYQVIQIFIICKVLFRALTNRAKKNKSLNKDVNERKPQEKSQEISIVSFIKHDNHPESKNSNSKNSSFIAQSNSNSISKNDLSPQNVSKSQAYLNNSSSDQSLFVDQTNDAQLEPRSNRVEKIFYRRAKIKSQVLSKMRSNHDRKSREKGRNKDAKFWINKD